MCTIRLLQKNICISTMIAILELFINIFLQNNHINHQFLNGSKIYTAIKI